MSRTRNPQLSFADLEMQRLGVELDPVLRHVSDLLEDNAALVELVRQDLNRGLKSDLRIRSGNPSTGRSGIAPAQTLRSLALMKIKNWDYRELR